MGADCRKNLSMDSIDQNKYFYSISRALMHSINMDDTDNNDSA